MKRTLQELNAVSFEEVLEAIHNVEMEVASNDEEQLSEVFNEFLDMLNEDNFYFRKQTIVENYAKTKKNELFSNIDEATNVMRRLAEEDVIEYFSISLHLESLFSAVTVEFKNKEHNYGLSLFIEDGEFRHDGNRYKLNEIYDVIIDKSGINN